ncbi:hypothetical protein NDU88_007376 [Pleurodeles waltl]|uniref:Uncharacterized protein n=1 Tax=Pleurodeles waltl TaxID=8319 RepID=A0AAV7VTF8_PLEWA|nr:hypothetical protein NDU88_007376 [Pleurodeles waltl]
MERRGNTQQETRLRQQAPRSPRPRCRLRSPGLWRRYIVDDLERCKAFDYLIWDYLFEVLKKFDLGLTSPS